MIYLLTKQNNIKKTRLSDSKAAILLAYDVWSVNLLPYIPCPPTSRELPSHLPYHFTNFLPPDKVMQSFYNSS